MQASLNILIACGGTGGHLFPGIAVAQDLLKRGHKPLLLISKKQVDRDASDKYGDTLEFRTIPAVAKPPLLSLRTPAFLLKMASTYWKSRQLLKRERIDVVIGMGGFTSLAPIMAAAHMKIPCYVHDSNALPGKANRLTARWCHRVLLGLADAQRHFPQSHCVLTGTPTRVEFQPDLLVSRADARACFGLSPEGAAILVLGGSQGAKRLNELVLEAAAQDTQTQYLIIAGKAHEAALQAQARSYENVRVLGFCAQMAEAYAACEGVISRAGASTLTELSLLGKASLLVPYPAAADDHQSYNARAYSTRDAAQLCAESELTVEAILGFTQGIIAHPEKRQAMEKAMLEMSIPDAASRIAQMLSEKHD